MQKTLNPFPRRKLNKNPFKAHRDNVKYLQKTNREFIIEYLKNFASSTSIHGVKYLSQEEAYLLDKVVWAITIILALLTSSYVSILISERFNTVPIATVIETTNYHISDIPFPAISICPSNQLNFSKKNEVIDTFFPNRSQLETNIFMEFFELIHNLEFGVFNIFQDLVDKNISFKFLEKVNVTEITLFMLHDCEDHFVWCWFGHKYVNCCDLFAVQITEIGICYSFNSYSNIGSKLSNKSNSKFPHRIARRGEWSGLKFVVRDIPDAVKSNSEFTGLKVIINHPAVFPNIYGILPLIPPGTRGSIEIVPTVFSTNEDVKGLEPGVRQCLFTHEVDTSEMEIPFYSQQYCWMKCRQEHVNRFCNCNFQSYHPPNSNPDCNATGYLCMTKFNDAINDLKPPDGNPFFDSKDEGIFCDCLPSCEKISYEVKMQSISQSKNRRDLIELDIHFESETMIKYRTDVVFGFLDWLVAIGGIAGLFLGASVISFVEVVYHITIGLFWEKRRMVIARIIPKSRFSYVH